MQTKGGTGVGEGMTRREMLIASVAAMVAGCSHSSSSHSIHDSTKAATRPTTQIASTQPTWKGPIIDVHQHTNYHGRTDAALLHHQKRLGASQTALPPSGWN